MDIQPAQVLKQRIGAQHLIKGRKPDLAKICREVGGIQAQVISSAEQSLWARHQGIAQKDIHSSINKTRKLVKTYAMRGTIHLVNSEDFPVYIEALKESRLRSSYQIMGKFGITSKAIDTFNEVVLKHLDRHPLSKKDLWNEIKSELNKNTLEWKKYIWNVFKHSMEAGLICYGTMASGDVKLVRVDQWIGKVKGYSKEEAQRELMQIYLRAFGPASEKDFARWSGLTLTDARNAMEELQPKCTRVNWGKSDSGFILNSELRKIKALRDDVDVSLLPNFDTYLLGHTDKSFYLHPSKTKKVYRSAGWISPVVLVDGRVYGTWAIEKKGQVLRISKFEKFTASLKDAIKEEAEKLSSFLETDFKVRFT